MLVIKTNIDLSRTVETHPPSRLRRIRELVVDYEPGLGRGYGVARVHYKDGRLKGTNISPAGTVQVMYKDWREKSTIDAFLALLRENACYVNDATPVWINKQQVRGTMDQLWGWTGTGNRVVAWAIGAMGYRPLSKKRQEELWQVLGLTTPSLEEALEHTRKTDRVLYEKLMERL